MSDPPRLVHAYEHSLEAALLHSARRDTPPAHAHERMLSTLGIAASAVTAATTTAKATAAVAVVHAKPTAVGITSAFVAKWAIVGSVGAVVTVGAVQQVPVLLGHAARPAAVISSAARGSNARMPNSGAVSALVPQPASQEPEIALAEPAHGDSRLSAGPARSAAVSRSPTPSSLAAEVSAIDGVRTAAVEHNPTRTLALLDAYQRQFPNGSLGPEAQLLRIEALVQAGRRAEAVPIARHLLDAAPDGPLSERVRTLLPEMNP